MGHDSVTRVAKRKLTSTEVNQMISAMQADEQSEYGYNHSFGSSTGKIHNSHMVYSSYKAQDIAQNVESYESIAVYFISSEVWNKHFKVEETIIHNLQKRIQTKKKSLEQLVSAAHASSKDPAKITFFSCPKCKSKINMSMIRYDLTRCLVCGHSAPEFAIEWKSKKYGKTFAKKEAKLNEEIDALKLQIKLREEKRPTEALISSLPAKMQKEIQTIVASDYHS